MATPELEIARAELERHRQNSARLAMAYANFETTGQGTLEFEQRVDFGLTFIERPFPQYCAEVDLDELGDQLGLEPGETPPLPVVSGFVTDWDTDDRGFYTGAWVAASVVDPTAQIPLDTSLTINHYFTFQAVAIKDIPPDVTD
ncbi:MAG: hypothetical protein HOV97_05015 [Nonomuraea sp.]|nr:hypothetical protein [Nonomuraea sp.]